MNKFREMSVHLYRDQLENACARERSAVVLRFFFSIFRRFRCSLIFRPYEIVGVKSVNELKQKRCYQTHDNRANRNFRNNPKKILLCFFFIWRLAFSRFCRIRYSNTLAHTHSFVFNLTRCTYSNIYAYRNFNASLWMKIYELAFPWSCALFSCFV